MSEALDKMVAAIKARRETYETLATRADPLADDDCNRHERMRHAVEAFELLEAEIDAILKEPEG